MTLTLAEFHMAIDQLAQTSSGATVPWTVDKVSLDCE